MSQIEQGLKALGTGSFKAFLRRHTRNHLASISGGVVATALLQSSSVVGLMTLAFVGAGLLEMSHALGIVIGSNLGTTFTGWIVATLGFKLNLTEFYLPVFAIGALGLSFLPQHIRAFHWCRTLLGLGLLLMGLVLMKDSAEGVAAKADIGVIAGQSLAVFFFFGVVFTAIIQSSSATMVITLSALNANIIGLEQAAVLVIGADLGTTGTVLLGSVKGTAAKRQVAMAHFLFNLVTDLVALAALPLYLYLVTDIYQLTDPLMGLVAFHSSFNLVGIALFAPFLPKFADLLRRWLPDKLERRNRYIHQIPANTPQVVMDANIEAINKELSQLLADAIEFSQGVLGLARATPVDSSQYASIKQLEAELLDYVYDLQEHPMLKSENAQLSAYQVALREAVYSIKAMKDIHANMQHYAQSDDTSLRQLFGQMKEHMQPWFRDIHRLLHDPQTMAVKDALLTLHQRTHQFHQQLHQQTLSADKQDQLADDKVSSLLNVNRELFIAQQSLLRAFGHFLLWHIPGDELAMLTG